MKALFLVIGAAALSGCVAYVPSAFDAPYQSGILYGEQSPAYGYGYGATVVPHSGLVYPSYGYRYGYAYPGYSRTYPYVYPWAHPSVHPRTHPHLQPHVHPHLQPHQRPHAQPHQQPPSHGQVPGRGNRDRDRDGVPNRRDRDRDGDGAPNRYDRHPGDPGRR